MTSIAVRVLDVEEWPLYRSVRLAALADSPKAFLSTLSHEETFTPDIWRSRLEQRNTFVAEDDGGEDGEAEVRGLVSIVPRDPDVAEIVSMWVHPAARGRGAADLLVRAALAWAHERGVPEVRLWVAEGNDRAERLYARHGFQRTGTVQPLRDREVELEFSMSRSLRGGDVAGLQPPAAR
jgi:ribosomal protein S18 acetylase RimI-like enzyme